MYVNNVRNMLVCESENWAVPLVRKLGHLFYEWTAVAIEHVVNLYSTQELTRIHRHFFHPHAERLYSLMKIADDPEINPQTLEALEDITKSCDVCQRLAREPGRFCVSLPPGEVVFNRTISMDIMTLEGRTVLHIIDNDTKFGAAQFLQQGESTKNTWDVFVRIWVHQYIGYPDVIQVDQGPQFQSTEWKNYLRSMGIRSQNAGVESQNAIGTVERYHKYLRDIYRKVRMTHPHQDREETLATAVHAMNCTAGPEGLSPILLVFGVFPRIPVRPQQLPKQEVRMKAMADARKEMSKLIGS